MLQGIFLKPYIEKRAVEIGTYIVEKSATVRQAAKNFGVSKSTVLCLEKVSLVQEKSST